MGELIRTGVDVERVRVEGESDVAPASRSGASARRLVRGELVGEGLAEEVETGGS